MSAKKHFGLAAACRKDESRDPHKDHGKGNNTTIKTAASYIDRVVFAHQQTMKVIEGVSLNSVP